MVPRAGCCCWQHQNGRHLSEPLERSTACVNRTEVWMRVLLIAWCRETQDMGGRFCNLCSWWPHVGNTNTEAGVVLHMQVTTVPCLLLTKNRDKKHSVACVGKLGERLGWLLHPLMAPLLCMSAGSPRARSSRCPSERQEACYCSVCLGGDCSPNTPHPPAASRFSQPTPGPTAKRHCLAPAGGTTCCLHGRAVLVPTQPTTGSYATLRCKLHFSPQAASFVATWDIGPLCQAPEC